MAIVGLLALLGLSVAQEPQKFTGTISDAVCGRAGHARMRMGPTDADCANLCVDAHGAAYVLDDAKTVYTLTGSTMLLQEFAARNVTVTGVLDPKTKAVRVQSIEAAK